MVRVGLRTRSRKVKMKPVTLLGHRAEKLLRHSLATFPVERGHILSRDPGAVGHRAEFGSRLAFRILDHLLSRRLDEL